LGVGIVTASFAVSMNNSRMSSTRRLAGNAGLTAVVPVAATPKLTKVGIATLPLVLYRFEPVRELRAPLIADCGICQRLADTLSP
jgi:hypothetical protein